MIDELIYENDLYDDERDGAMTLCDNCGHPGMNYDMSRGDDANGYVCWSCDRDEQSEYYMTHRRYH